MSRPPDRSWMLATLMTLPCANASRTMVGARDTAPSVAPAALRNLRRSARMLASGRVVLEQFARVCEGRSLVRVNSQCQAARRAVLACFTPPVYSARAMDLAAVLALEILNGIASLVLISLVLVGIAAAILVAIYVVLRTTRLGLLARGTMENPNMAAALGVSPPRVYAATFGVGAALTGLAGGLLAPISGVLPTVGAAYVAKAFITVISGGTAIMAGTASAASLFRTVNQLLTYLTTPVIGEAGLLAAAILLLRVLPHGITGKLFRGSL